MREIASWVALGLAFAALVVVGEVRRDDAFAEVLERGMPGAFPPDTPEVRDAARRAVADLRAGVAAHVAAQGRAPTLAELQRLAWEQQPDHPTTWVPVRGARALLHGTLGPPPPLSEEAAAALARAFPDGLPSNPLTGSRAVVGLCGPARQDLVSGDAADWHYCADSGRVYACGGRTSAPTVDW